MVSLKKFLPGSQEGEDALSRLLSLLIEALAVHAVEYHPQQKVAFQRTVREIAERLSVTKSPVHALMLAGEIINVLRTYNREVEIFVGAKAKELQSMVAMLTDTVVQACGATAASSRNLMDLERNLEHADKIEDIRVLKGRLSDHLKTMRQEIEQQQHRYDQLKTKVSQVIADPLLTGLARQEEATVPVREAVVSERDPTTGLATARMAESAISNALARGTPFAPVVFVIDRLNAINDRYGFSVGDEVLILFGRHLLERFGFDALFRWRGPSFLVILDRDGQSEALRREIQRLISGRLEHTVNSGSRSVLLPVHWTWATIPVSASTQAATITGEIDRFVAKQFKNSA